MARTIWHLGNTTVRSPFRLREGLIALSESNLNGSLRGRDQEIAFRNLLGERGVVELGDDETYSVGRKWRSALSKLGFIFPALPNQLSESQSEVGPIDFTSTNGLRLINADTVPAMQECFLRSLAAYRIPNPAEKDYAFEAFSPLKFVIQIMLELEKSGEGYISFNEMALFVITSTPSTGIPQLAQSILEFRQNRDSALNKRAFDNDARKARAAALNYVATTFDDYADTTIRYLKATGLMVAKGRGIALFADKKVLIEDLAKEEEALVGDVEYFTALSKGAALPTDEIRGARRIYSSARTRALELGIEVEAELSLSTNIADLNLSRHRIEELIFRREEEIYALRQSDLVDEILQYIDILDADRRTSGRDQESIFVPRSERPAYLEWVLWRAFLAMNQLVNKPYESRRFKVDQSFLPIGPAAGNGPDLIFEFSEYVLVVEATLTDNSRQEAAEGETVRRHVTDVMKQYPNKDVFGLFIARNINTNTAHTFKLGIWYSTADQKIAFSIVPITLGDFKSFFTMLMSSNGDRSSKIRQFLERCLAMREGIDAPAWKTYINSAMENIIANG